MGGCQNCGSFLGSLNTVLNQLKIQTGTIILTTTYIQSLIGHGQVIAECVFPTWVWVDISRAYMAGSTNRGPSFVGALIMRALLFGSISGL